MINFISYITSTQLIFILFETLVESIHKSIQKNALKYCVKKKIIEILDVHADDVAKLTKSNAASSTDKKMTYHIANENAINNLNHLCLMLKSFQ